MVINVVFLSSGGQSGVKFPGQFLKNGWTKTNAPSTVCSTAWDTHHVKKWDQSVHSSRSYRKNNVPNQMTPRRETATFRAKIDLLNYIERHIKYIWGQSPLSDESNELTIESKKASFDGVTFTYTKCSGHELVKIEVCVLANFSKTAERNKTLFTAIQVRLKLSSNQQTDQKSVHSTRRYSNIKVTYQMTKSPKYGSCFAEIHHLDYIKLHTNYIWGDSPLRQQTKFHGEIQHEVTIQSFQVYPPYRYPASLGQNCGTCPGQFLKNSWLKRIETYIKTKPILSWV